MKTAGQLLQPILNTSARLGLQDSPQTVPGWNSIAQINIIVAIEDLIGEELSTTEVLGLDSVQAIINICRTHGVEMSID